MHRFAGLLERLIYAPSRTGKLTHLRLWFAETPDPDRGWSLAAITGDLSFNAAKAGTLRALATQRMDPVLFALSYDYVGDLAETIALAWPSKPGANRAPSLSDAVEALGEATRPQAAALIETWLDALDPAGRWALLKLVTGGFRVGVSARLAKQALADFGGVEVAEIEALWHGLAPPYLDLFAWLDGRAGKPETAAAAPFRPVMLAHPLIPKAKRDDPDAVDPAAVTPEVYAAEWKWDGVRVQAVREGGARRLYTRTGDDISEAFPDVLASLEIDAAIDGELLVRNEAGGVASFNDLQQRLNRKLVSAAQMKQRPAFVRAYDLLWEAGRDWRAEPFRARRAALEAFVARAASDRLDLSALVAYADFDALRAAREAPPEPVIEGLMLKRWDSVYEIGRPKGLWWKWKRDPFLIDAVLLYAQRGHGKRSSYYSDFTFGVWRTEASGEALVPVGKAYFGFSDEELKALDAFVRENTVERFGPVRRVAASADVGLVLEVAFEGLARSPRHKSGVAMRFPRINRIRWDKPAREADTLQNLEALLT